MPPKKQQPSKAAKQAKAKVAEDKTFGLKNKNKSSKVNKFIQQVKANAEAGGKAERDAALAKQQQKEKKEAEQKRKEELAELFKVVQPQQKVPFGTDPKSILCNYFKAGQCTKGAKCKFSHDLNIERKSSKRDLYSDDRDKTEKSLDTMDKWDQEKLEKVVSAKGNPRTTTEIVCKHFLEAIDNEKYGWFWECPAGPDCKYRHALPPGFVLKSKKTKDTTEQVITLEEFLETERHRIVGTRTPVTLESFKKWKTERQARKEAEELEARKKKENAVRAGKNMNVSGRELFDFNPDLARQGYEDDEDAFDLSQLRNIETEGDEEDEEEEEKEDGAEGGGEEKRKKEEGGGGVKVDAALFEAEDIGDLSSDEEEEK